MQLRTACSHDYFRSKLRASTEVNTANDCIIQKFQPKTRTLKFQEPIQSQINRKSRNMVI